MTISEILRNSKLSPLDAELILSSTIKKPKEFIFAHPEYELSSPQLGKFTSFVKRRLKGEPVAYIVEKKEFFGLEFAVDKNVLIPRPETELLVEAALRGIMNYESGIRNVVDVGMGSGNIIVSIAKNTSAKIRRKVNFYALDISRKSLYIAKGNAKKHGVAKSIKFIESDLLRYFLEKKTKFENLLIVANLPYVSHELYRKNSANLKFEPRKALLSNEKGLRHYIRLIGEIREIIDSGGVSQVTFYVEISPEQKTSLTRIIKKNFPSAKLAFLRDLSKRKRVAVVDIGIN
ncbi:MAG: peptide chain release factor N(5)-glutamine methyltransferase [Patescibacteria group bacterium]|nr:peptide chain release factor N(5)-glutamine methyltransferase [Patescibacteria group bacterium]